jgi:hypothetical protein
MRFASSALLAALVLTDCTSDTLTTPSTTAPQLVISDGSHEGGVKGFYFLPPMMPQPATAGTFDADIATLAPVITFCDVTDGPDLDCGGATAAILTLTTATVPAIGVGSGQYQVNWDTKVSGFSAGRTYRLHVWAGTATSRRELGYADVLLTSTPGQVKDLATNDIVVLNDGRTLPLHFRIETGIAGSAVVAPAAASVFVGATQPFAATLYDLHHVALTGQSFSWTSSDASISSVDATGLASAAAPGSAAIAATASGVTGSAQLTVVQPVGTVSGRVFTLLAPQFDPNDPYGMDGSHFSAILLPAAGNPHPPIPFRPDASGNFAVSNVPVGSWRLGSFTAGCSGGAVDLAPVTNGGTINGALRVTCNAAPVSATVTATGTITDPITISMGGLSPAFGAGVTDVFLGSFVAGNYTLSLSNAPAGCSIVGTSFVFIPPIFGPRLPVTVACP